MLLEPRPPTLPTAPPRLLVRRPLFSMRFATAARGFGCPFNSLSKHTMQAVTAFSQTRAFTRACDPVCHAGVSITPPVNRYSSSTTVARNVRARPDSRGLSNSRAPRSITRPISGVNTESSRRLRQELHFRPNWRRLTAALPVPRSGSRIRQKLHFRPKARRVRDCSHVRAELSV